MPFATKWVPKSWAAQLALEQGRRQLEDEAVSPAQEPQPEQPESDLLQDQWRPGVIEPSEKVSEAWQPSATMAGQPEPLSVEQDIPQTRAWQPATPPVAVATPEPSPPKKEYALWEKPAQTTEAVMGKVGEIISKTPVLPKILSWAAPAFKWWEEHVDKPFAAVVTAPFSPDIPWKTVSLGLNIRKGNMMHGKHLLMLRVESLFLCHCIGFLMGAGWLVGQSC